MHSKPPPINPLNHNICLPHLHSSIFIFLSARKSSPLILSFMSHRLKRRKVISALETAQSPETARPSSRQESRSLRRSGKNRRPSGFVSRKYVWDGCKSAARPLYFLIRVPRLGPNDAWTPAKPVLRARILTPRGRREIAAFLPRAFCPLPAVSGEIKAAASNFLVFTRFYLAAPRDK